LTGKVKSGVDGLDEVIEGGFPRGSLILLAGEPGVGKTVFSMQFLVKGAELNESGIYVSFAETKNTLIENFSRHLNVDLAKLEVEGKIKILDFTAMKEEGISAILESILAEVKALNAKRLVIDSFSAMAQAFKEPIDVRIIVQTILSRIVREMGCTTIMVEEVPIGRAEIGLGMEEFVADGLIRLRANELDKRLFRDLEIVKLRGVRLDERKLAFTLEGGFKAFTPFKLKPIEKPNRFQPIPDPPDKYSTGVRDLDEVLGGGLPKGLTILLEVAGKVSMLEYLLILLPMMLNFVVQGRPVILIPAIGIDAEFVRSIALSHGISEDEVNRLLRVCEPLSPRKNQKKPYIAVFEGKDLWRDYESYLKLEERLLKETGQPALSVSCLDTLLAYYGEENCEKLFGQDAIRVRERNTLAIGILKPGYKRLAEKLSGIADIHLRLTREHGCLLLYGVKPRTGLYGVEMDVSRGYPLPKLTPIV
jgi:KaiC/GvpD/RAD55 family RecA-like ATPase